MVGRMTRGEIFAAEGTQRSNYQRMMKESMWLTIISAKCLVGGNRYGTLPFGFGEVSIVYRSFMLLIS